MNAVISQRMKRAAYEFERAAIDEGFAYCKLVYESPNWSVLDKNGSLSIKGFDDDEKFVSWTEGE